ncbi:ArsR family transcriptional regulator [Vibrio anguillarum]|uniref:winged helix-turn-helix domain-containing protein n=1 Tax=Vibrio anguillarum TaxID=55601 RepID=UPI00188B39B0|nr:winged helix-turn-helix domain-containing protein [Vibrio anguillarum]MBF4318394.1 ArsR family transcriptional regulator [Vibrio anguillarum]MBF4385268.1 ArsR family transcriptional regulator [Vibrio anguillarum]MBF4392138.1 ArsR family transcriptional regulator [Vibrio anguillarum]MBF4431227.1 ArsR family transcriptional regulator [Vibrio anguillarum]
MIDEELKIKSKTKYTTTRDDGQECLVDLKINEETSEYTSSQKSALFYAFNRKNYKNKVLLAREEPLANSILELLISEMDDTNAICISMATLEKLFKLSRQTLSKHIKILEERNFIEIFKNGNMNVYAINAFFVWTQGDKNLWKAKFKATMYLDFDEQSSQIKRKYSKEITTK